jgi:hypothetical protein
VALTRAGLRIGAEIPFSRAEAAVRPRQRKSYRRRLIDADRSASKQLQLRSTRERGFFNDLGSPQMVEEKTTTSTRGIFQDRIKLAPLNF